MVPFFTSLFLFFGWFGGGGNNTSAPQPRSQTTDKVIVVQVDVQYPTQADKCYLTTFDKKKVEIAVKTDDTLNSLQDFIYEEDPIEGPGCFMPQMKLIFQNSTYVVSLYCTSVLKYKNSAPFIPSSLKLKNDLEITESVLAYLKKLHRRYFGVPANPGPNVCQRFLKSEPLNTGDSNDDLPDDDDGVDKELEKDAHDNNGWFDPKVEPEEPIKTPD